MKFAWALGLALLGSRTSPPVAPMSLVVSTPRGDVRIAVRNDSLAGPVVPASVLVGALGGTVAIGTAWADVGVARMEYRFLIGGPVYAVDGALKPLVGPAVVTRDSLFLPIEFVTRVLPGESAGRFRYDPEGGRLEEVVGPVQLTKVVARSPEPKAANLPPSKDTKEAKDVKNAKDVTRSDRLPNGLRRGHVVAIDPGHGGVDPGNPGLFFPNGQTESDVTLAVGLQVRRELLKRGIGVIMTRTTDTLINLYDRGGYCTDRCDLFVSIHVNSLARRAGYTKVRGFETYFLATAKTEDAARVAKMENEAVRFDQAKAEGPEDGIDFILKDLQLNEYLRESARLAELMQSHMAEVHTGPDKGVKQAGLVVLTTARRPAVLVEMGFSTNPEDAAMMTRPQSQKNLAASLADAIVSYLLEYERRADNGTVSSQTGDNP